MRMQWIGWWVLCVLGGPVLLAAETPEQPARPNVLFLICDDLNCDLGCYGNAQVQTPHLDALAARGTRFTQTYCQYPLCGPSRASFMTGLYPDQTLIKQNSIFLRETMPRVKTMSMHFRDAGYLATRIGKIYHYNVPSNIGTAGHDDPDSWDLTFNPRGRDKDEESRIFSLRPGAFGATLSWLAAEGTDREQTDGIAADLAIERLQHHARTGVPFFLAVGLYRPHTPFVAPRAYFERHPLEAIEVPQIPEGYLETLPAPAVKSLTRMKDQVGLDPDLARQAIQAYHASISFADAQVGRILQALRDAGLEDNTIVLFTSDHGYHMGQHGHYQKSTLFEDATRVPLILAGPGVGRGQTTSALTEMIDFYPTLASLAGLQTPGFLAGESLVPVLQDPAATVRQGALSTYQNGYSLRTARYRLTSWGDQGQEGRELYDRQQDPGEMNNLAGQPEYAELEARLADQLERRIEAARQIPPGMRHQSGTRVQVVPANRNRR